MNYSRIALAALGATVAYFVVGGILFGALPSLRKEFMKYPAVYRTQDDMKRVMPMGMISILVAIFVVAVLYAMAYPAGGGVLDGARFGALIGVFAVCGFCAAQSHDPEHRHQAHRWSGHRVLRAMARCGNCHQPHLHASPHLLTARSS